MNEPKKIEKPCQAGFSLLELLLVIGVGTTLLLSGIGVYRIILKDKTANDTIQAILMTKSGIQRLFRTERTYGTVSLLNTAISAKIFPGTVHVDTAGPTVYHPFGGTMDITGAGSSFTITVSGLGTSPCIMIGEALNPETADDMLSLTVDSGAVTTFDETNPATPPGLAGACTSNMNQMIFTFM